MRPVIQAAVIRADAQMGEQYLVGPALGWRPSVLLRSASCVLARQRAGAPRSATRLGASSRSRARFLGLRRPRYPG